MGGTIAVTVREASGQEHRMFCWTNPLPSLLNNLALAEGRPEAIRDLLAEAYPPEREPPGLYPETYGLIVVDFQRHVILDGNTYSQVGVFRAQALLNEMEATGYNPDLIFWADGVRLGKKAFIREKPEDYLDAQRFLDFVLAGRVNVVSEWDRRTQKRTPRPLALKNVDQVVDYLRKKKSHASSVFPVDMAPFQVLRYEDTQEDMKAMYAYVLDMGFALSDREKEGWQAYLRRKEVSPP